MLSSLLGRRAQARYQQILEDQQVGVTPAPLGAINGDDRRVAELIDGAVGDLGSTRARRRDKAADRIRRLGPKALPALYQAFGHGLPAICRGAQRLVQDIVGGLPGDGSADAKIVDLTMRWLSVRDRRVRWAAVDGTALWATRVESAPAPALAERLIKTLARAPRARVGRAVAITASRLALHRPARLHERLAERTRAAAHRACLRFVEELADGHPERAALVQAASLTSSVADVEGLVALVADRKRPHDVRTAALTGLMNAATGARDRRAHARIQSAAADLASTLSDPDLRGLAEALRDREP